MTHPHTTHAACQLTHETADPCPTCGTNHRPVICAGCHTGNPTDASFCGGCGAELLRAPVVALASAADALPQAPPAPSAIGIDDEVEVMFDSMMVSGEHAAPPEADLFDAPALDEEAEDTAVYDPRTEDTTHDTEPESTDAVCGEIPEGDPEGTVVAIGVQVPAPYVEPDPEGTVIAQGLQAPAPYVEPVLEADPEGTMIVDSLQAPAPYADPVDDGAVEADEADEDAADCEATNDLQNGGILDLGPALLEPAPRQAKPNTEIPGIVSSRSLAPANVVRPVIGAGGEQITARVIEAGDTVEIDHDGSDRNYALLTATSEGVRVDGVGEIYVRVAGPTELRDRATIRVGRKRLAFERISDDVRDELSDPGTWGCVSVSASDLGVPAAHMIVSTGVTIGREVGEVTLADDTFVSGAHCELTCDGERVYLDDLGSKNGTYLRVEAGEEVPFGTVLLMEGTLFEIIHSSQGAMVLELGVLEDFEG